MDKRIKVDSTKGQCTVVTPIRDGLPTDVDLPNGFIEAAGFGTPRCELGGVRLVRLGDVAKWLCGHKERPLSDAIDMILERLRPEHWDSLAELASGDGWAKGLAPDDRFGLPTQEQLNRKRGAAIRAQAQTTHGRGWVTMDHGAGQWAMESAIRKASQPARVAVESGFPALIHQIKKCWSAKVKPGQPQWIDSPKVPVSRLALPLPLAHELWGCGRPITRHTTASAPVTPPNGWVLQSPFGYQGLDGTEDGRTVRLVDVVSEIKKRDTLPYSEAVNAVCARFADLMPGDIYTLHPKGFAKPWGFSEGADETESQYFGAGGSVTQQEFAGLLKRMACNLGRFDAHEVNENSPSLDAIALSSTPSDVHHAMDLDELKTASITLRKAHELWGYGEPSAKPTAATTTTAVNVQQSEWTGVQLAALREKLQKEGVKAFTQKMVELTGLAEREIRRRINPTKPKKAAAGPFDGLKSARSKPRGKAA